MTWGREPRNLTVLLWQGVESEARVAEWEQEDASEWGHLNDWQDVDPEQDWYAAAGHWQTGPIGSRFEAKRQARRVSEGLSGARVDAAKREGSITMGQLRRLADQLEALAPGEPS